MTPERARELACEVVHSGKKHRRLVLIEASLGGDTAACCDRVAALLVRETAAADALLLDVAAEASRGIVDVDRIEPSE